MNWPVKEWEANQHSTSDLTESVFPCNDRCTDAVMMKVLEIHEIAEVVHIFNKLLKHFQEGQTI